MSQNNKKHPLRLLNHDMKAMLNHGHTIQVSEGYDGFTKLSVQDVRCTAHVERMLTFGFEYDGSMWFKQYEVQD